MLNSHCIEKLVGFKDVLLKNIESDEKSIEIELEHAVKTQICPACKAETRNVHDYRKQQIKDIPAFGKQILLILRKRRYRCRCCGKCFYEPVEFLPRYYRMTNRLAAYIISELRNECSFTSVAARVNLSVSTVIRIFDLVGYGKPELPRVLSIDEFRGNASGEKYQCIITDPENKVVLDILPKRYGSYLCEYFKDLNRKNVEYFVSDMWRTYSDFADTFFKNATQIVDKYHYIRQVIWAFEGVRKEEQKKFSKSHRLYFKRSKTLLTRRFAHLSEDEVRQVNIMLYASARLSTAHFLKEEFFKLLDCKDKIDAKKMMSDWIMNAQNSGIDKFEGCAKTFLNWSEGILNSFDYKYTNGFTEGCNNKIKVLKRNAYGYRNFKRFRNRILHMFSHQRQNKKAVG